MFKRINRDLGRDLFLYGLSFLLLMEWLFPLPYISDTGFMKVFFYATALFFVITFLQLPLLLSLFLKVIIICYGVCIIFFDGSFFSFEWFSLLLAEVMDNINLMMANQWYALSDLFRSLLFFTLLAIASYLLFYWTIQVRRIMFFLFFTVIYVAVIDTFSDYDATYAMIRTFVIGFLLLGLVTIYRRIETESNEKVSSFLPVRLAALLVVMIMIGGVIGFLFPKPDPQWSDPVPFVKSAMGLHDDGGGRNDRRIGYGENDEQLGGGFKDDDTPVFYAVAEEDHYWRGETKDFYTGKGWESTTPFVEGEEPLYIESDETLEAEVVFSEGTQRFNHLFYPGKLLTKDSIMDVSLSFDKYSSKARTYLNGSPVSLSHYEYKYVLPQFNAEELRASSEIDPELIKKYYTQLPDELPDRVAELAADLTEDHDNRYDKVKAIELHFASSRFKYETTNVPLPEEEEDYVDQFLFVSQQGYCDNFSTSMIVLLRSQGIPARWAKGFTQGEKVETLDEGQYIYQVTNGNAHSWVEVYFPSAGWVPFEPTKGFDQAYNAVEHSASLDEEKDEDKENEEAEKKEKDDEAAMLANGEFSNHLKTLSLGMLGILVICLFLILLLKNKKIVYYYTLNRFKNKQDGATFASAYDNLLSVLNRYGYKRRKGETLREYAVRLDEQLSTNEMVILTSEYEQIMYGGKPEHDSWQSQRSTWLSFMHKLKS